MAKSARTARADAPGIALEKIVARLHQMMDPMSTVTHNEWLEDRLGHRRQCDAVMRGQFGGRPILGVIECKDHSRKKGPDAVEAFAKKAEHLGANMRLMVSRKGFTEQALSLAKHEGIGCLSLLPEDPAQCGFSIGEMWYGLIRKWTDVRLTIHFALPTASIPMFDSEKVTYGGKPVMLWFIKELLTRYGDRDEPGEFSLQVLFDSPRNIEVEGTEYPVCGLTCTATRICQNKRKWVSWSGDALFDWHTGKMTIPAGAQLVGSAVETDLSLWDNYDGEVTAESDPAAASTFLRVVAHDTQKWDDARNHEVPDLSSL